jgi:hypothetical protein
MSNYIWTEKRIQEIASDFKGESGWLKNAAFRNYRRNASQLDRLSLMRVLVNKNFAFPRPGKSESSPKYEISFDWENRAKLLAELKVPKHFFQYELLSHPIMLDLPPARVLGESELTCECEFLLGRSLTDEDHLTWFEVKNRWSAILEILCKLQKTGKLKPRNLPKGTRLSPSEKDCEQAIFALAKELVCMYEALEIGWTEIQEKWENVHEFPHEAFIGMVEILSFADFVSNCRDNTYTGGIHANLQKLKDIQAGEHSFKAWSDMVSQLQPEDMARLFRHRLADPNVLKSTDGIKAFTLNGFDPDKYDKLIEASHSLSINKDMLTPELEELLRVGRGFEFRQLLLAGINPEVRSRALEWEEASMQGISIAKRLLWRLSAIKTS